MKAGCSDQLKTGGNKNKKTKRKCAVSFTGEGSRVSLAFYFATVSQNAVQFVDTAGAGVYAGD